MISLLGLAPFWWEGLHASAHPVLIIQIPRGNQVKLYDNNFVVMAASDAEREIALLKDRVAELERELTSVRRNGPRRERIQQMSAEVVDSNPYRWATVNKLYTTYVKSK